LDGRLYKMEVVMTAFKTKAIVEDSEHLKLPQKFDFLKLGSEIEILIMASPQPSIKWRQVLEEIGTYSEDDLKGFQDARKEMNKWKPKEF
jgi:hypothetical protein